MNVASASGTPAWRRLDRLMLVSLLAAGGFWLLLLSPPWDTEGSEGVGFFLTAATYVLLGALGMAGLYAREEVTLKQEVLMLVAVWTAAVLLWTAMWLNLGVTAEHHPGTAYLVNGVSWTGSISSGLWIATPCFLAWQLLALSIRAAWRRLSARRRCAGSTPAARPAHRGWDRASRGLTGVHRHGATGQHESRQMRLSTVGDMPGLYAGQPAPRLTLTDRCPRRLR